METEKETETAPDFDPADAPGPEDAPDGPAPDTEKEEELEADEK
jgi:hypothetical protein